MKFIDKIEINAIDLILIVIIHNEDRDVSAKSSSFFGQRNLRIFQKETL